MDLDLATLADIRDELVNREHGLFVFLSDTDLVVGPGVTIHTLFQMAELLLREGIQAVEEATE